MQITIPTRSRGRQTEASMIQYNRELLVFCNVIKEIRSRSDFSYSSRGWGYALEGMGITKSQFGAVALLINDCRKNGMLPVDICSEDVSRAFYCIEEVDNETPEEFAQMWIEYLLENTWQQYNGVSFWDDKEFYIEMLVEKIDLRKMFAPICKKFRIPIANAKGWPDINSRAAMMTRYRAHEAAGRQPILLYCGDHDPSGLKISDSYMDMFQELAQATGWGPCNLIIDRFGLNYDFIQQAGLSWIDNLETSSGKNLADPRHPDHYQPYVQEYLERYGARKVEANAIVVQPEMGKKLCLDAILKYLPIDAPGEYEEAMQPEREEVLNEIKRQLKEAA